jgi:hypothetical protein
MHTNEFRKLLIRSFHFFGFLAAVIVMALGATTRLPRSAENTSRSYLGFDRNDYPGDAAMKLLRHDFAFTSYWLSPPPGEKRNTWKGKRELLVSHGFGFLVLYCGRDSSELKTETDAKEKGSQDANASAAAAREEGFAPGTIIFLDIEEGGRLSPAYHEYLGVWSEELKRTGFLAGVYCSGIPVKEEAAVTVTTAEDIRNQAAPHEIVIWAFNDVCPPSPGCAFPRNPPTPSASGIPYAEVWQFAQSPRQRTHRTLSVEVRTRRQLLRPR